MQMYESKARKKKRIPQFLLGVLFILLVGVLGELLFNVPLFIGRENKHIKVNLNDVESSGFVYNNGNLHTDGTIATYDGKSKYISFKVKRQYIGKLRYEFYSDKPVRTKIHVNYYTGYGSSSAQSETIPDNNIVFMNESIENIRKTSDAITIEFTEMDQNIDISSINIDNNFSFAKKRMLFVCISAFLILYLIYASDTFEHHIERAFAVSCICIGGILCLSLPEHKVGWDDETHFYRVYALSEKMLGNKKSIVYPAVEQLMYLTEENYPTDMPRSKEEHKEEIYYFNSNGIYSERMVDDASDIPSEYIKELPDSGFHKVGYVTQAVFVSIAKLMRLPLSLVYLVGRTGNIFLYAIVMYFAIKKIPIGKYIMAGLSLLPTLMFSSGIYTYDIAVYSFISLAVAYILDEILNPDKIMKYSDFAVICISMILGNAPKVVYIPLILIVLFLPERKYKNSKAKYLCRGIVVIIFLAMLSTYVIPSINNTVEGDPRGGDTSVSRQLKLVLLHPLTYAKILFRSMKTTFGSYSFGLDSMGNMGFLDFAPFPILIPVYTFMLFLTDTQRNPDKQLKGKYRIVSLLAIFVTAALVWSALYLRFTEVGLDHIEGVQGRYFLPLLPLMYLSLQSNNIENHIPENIYSRLIIGIPIFITMGSVYSLLITKCI